MAGKKYATQAMDYPSRDYQCEEDVRTLQRAAEVMADGPRKRKALGAFRKQQTGGQKMLAILAGGNFKRG